MRYFSTLIITIISISALFCQTIYVKQNGNGDGSSWQQAMGDLQVALQEADFGVEVWVAEGIYKPTYCSTCGEVDKNTAFVLKDGVKLLGGFKGAEASSDQRLASENITILSGDIDGDNSLSNNSYTVVLTEEVSNQTLIDGFIIRDGNADSVNAGLGQESTSGAGFYNNGRGQGVVSHPVIRNCIFTDNYALGYGGAIYSDGSYEGNASPLLENVKFINNTANNSGGAFYGNAISLGLSDPIFRFCEFKGNKALDDNGGAMVHSGGGDGISNPIIEDCHFESNTAVLNGGAVFNSGNKGHCNPIFRRTVFVKNESSKGGAVFSDGSFEGETNPTFSDCEFLENHSMKDGGAVYNLASFDGFCQAVFERCNFENNQSTDSGGAILNNGSSGTCVPRFSNCEFIQNNATAFGAAFYNIGNSGHCNPDIYNCLFVKNRAYSAGAIYNLGSQEGQSNPNIINCTFVGNRANVGGAIYCNANDENGQSNPKVSNCIFYDNYAPTGEVFRIIYGYPEVEFCSFDLNSCDDLKDHVSSNINCGDGLIFSQELVFEDTLSGNFRLKSGASLIDQGSQAATMGANIQVDLDGNPRVVNGQVDYGAYEFTGASSIAPSITEEPQSQSACANEAVIFTIVASGSETISYQWQKDGSPIAGATQNMYQISSATLQDAGNYSCIVTNFVGTVESSIVTLTVKAQVEPMIQIVGPDTTVCIGELARIESSFVNGGTFPVFEWSKNNVSLPVNTDFYETNDLQEGDLIQCFLTSSVQCPTTNPVFSDQIMVSLDSCKSVSTIDIGEKYNIYLYPNPVSEVVNFEIEGYVGEIIVTIFNAQGSEIATKKVLASGSTKNYFSVDTPTIPAGTYFMNFKNEKKSTTHLFIKK